MKDIVVEQDVNPEVDKPSKKKQLDVGAGKDASAPTMDWDFVSIPLEPRGPGIWCLVILVNMSGWDIILCFGSREAKPQRRQRQVQRERGGDCVGDAEHRGGPRA